MNTSLSTQSHSEQEFSLSYSMSFGIGIEDAFGMSETLTEEYRAQIAHDVESSYAYDFTKTVTL